MFRKILVYIIIINAAIISILGVITMSLSCRTVAISRVMKEQEMVAKTEQLKIFRMKNRIEEIRCNAFLKAYNEGKYILELEEIDEEF